jgi:hypothetical protein
MTELVAVHALVELDPEGEQEIEGWREQLSGASDDEREDIRIRLHRYETGDEILVRLAPRSSWPGTTGGSGGPGRPSPECGSRATTRPATSSTRAS